MRPQVQNICDILNIENALNIHEIYEALIIHEYLIGQPLVTYWSLCPQPERYN